MPPYKQYLQQASTIGLPFISFDFYPIMDSGIRPTWYSCLEDIRQESLRTGKPFWAFALSTPHVIYPQPTLSMLRLQIYSNLAYGARAIQYFTYWNPKPTDVWDFHNAPIGLDGKRTSTYYLVKKMNQELRSILPLFDQAEITSVNHMGKIPAGTHRLEKLPATINSLKIVSNRGAIISTMKKNGRQYMLVVNKDYNSKLQLTIKAKPSVKRITKNLKETALKNTYSIDGGDILLFRLK